MRGAAVFSLSLTMMLAPPSALGAAPWGPAETVSRVPGAAVAAIDRNGLAVLAWTAHSAAYAARRTAHRGFGEPFALRRQRRPVDGAAVQFDSAGNALLGYRRFVGGNHRIETASLRPGGGRTTPTRLSGQGSSAFGPAFAAVPPGTFSPGPVLTWWRGEPGRVQLATGLGGRLRVPATGRLPQNAGVRYALGSDGVLLAATAVAGGVALLARPVGGAFRAPVALTQGEGAFSDTDIAAGPGGVFAASWRRFDGQTYRAEAVLFSSAGVGSTLTLSGPEERAIAPRVVVTADREVRVAYLSAPPGGDDAAPAGGSLRLATLGRPGAVTVTPPGVEVRGFITAADGRGGITLAWQRHERGPLGGAAFATAVTPAGRVGAPRRLAPPGERVYGLTLAVGPRGDALAAWSTTDPRLIRAPRGGVLRAVRRPASS